MGSFAFTLLFIGFLLFAAIWLWTRQRKQLGDEPNIDASIKRMTVAAGGDNKSAVLVTTEYGDLVHINGLARQWLGTNGVEPDLEDILRRVEPVDNLLSVLSEERQASFQMNGRWIEATSSIVPSQQGVQMVVVMRELVQNTGKSSDVTINRDDVMDVSLAMRTINSIGETVNASMGVELALQVLLEIVNRALPSDAGEICIWDDERKFLQQRGWIGDTRYLLTIAAQGAGYQVGKGVAGWMAQYRRPALISNNTDAMNVEIMMEGNPYESAVGVPITLGEDFVGTITLFSEQAGRYRPEDISLLQAVSNSIGTTVRNAELYAKQEERIQDIASLQQIAEQPKGEQGELSSIYKLLNERMANLLEAEMCGVFLYESTRQALVPQMPFYGLPDNVSEKFIIPLPAGSPQFDVWINQPYWVSNDVDEEPLVERLKLTGLVDVAGIRNTALFPLQIAGERIGVMAISNKRSEGGFLPTDIQNLRVLSSQAALVVENIRLYQRERRIDTELVGLQEMTHAIGALSHEGEFFLEISERIGRLMSSQMCGILLYDDAQKALISQLPFYGIDEDLIGDYVVDLPPNSIMEQLWQEDDFWYSNRVQTDTLVFTAGLDEIATRANIRNTLMAVMSAGGRRIGVAQVSNKLENQDYDEADARLLQIFATQAAAIIENARLYREVQTRAEQADRMRRVAQLASGTIRAEDSFEPVLQEIAALVDSPIVYINILDHNTNTLVTNPRYTYGLGLDNPLHQDLTQPGYERIAARSGTPFLTNDTQNDERVFAGYRTIGERFGMSKMMFVPLQIGDRILGELAAANRHHGDYTPNDLATFMAVGAQIASVVERLLLFEATDENLRRRVEELDAIARVSNELVLTTDLDRVLEVIREEAEKATGAEYSTIAWLHLQQDWRVIDVPELEHRIGDAGDFIGLADVEKQAITRGAEPLVIEDYESESIGAVPSIARSAIAVAVLYLDSVVGVIHIYDTKPNAFDQRGAEFLLTLATKASLAYQNYSLYQQQMERGERLSQRVDQLNRIFELGQMVQTNIDPIMTLEAIAYSVQQSARYDAVLMMLFLEDGLLHRVAHAGMPLQHFNETQSNTMTREELNDILKPDYNTSESYFFSIEDLKDWYHEKIDVLSAAYDENRSLQGKGKRYWHDGDVLIVTLVGQGGEILGLMSLDRPHDNLRPDSGSIAVLEIFAHQTSSMVTNTRLFQESQRNAEQEAKLNEVLESIAGTLDLGEIGVALAIGIHDLIAFTRMTFVVRDDAGNNFDYMRITFDEEGNPDVDRTHQASLTRTALGEVYNDKEQRIFTIDDEGDIQKFADLQRWYANGEKSSILLPLNSGGDVLGVVHIGSSDPDAFDVETQQLLGRTSQLIASAVQNARLFNQTMNLQVLNRSVVESIQQGIVVLDNSGHILTVNEFMKSAYGWTDEARGEDLFAYRPLLKDFLAGDLHEVLEQAVQRERINVSSVDKNEKMLVRNFYLYPLQSGDEVQGAVLLVEDVTQRTELEKAIEQRASQLAALTEVSTRITASLERDEVIDMAMQEMAWIIPYDTMTIWRRNGSYMVLEGLSGFEDHPDEFRAKITDHEAINLLVDTQRTVVPAMDLKIPNLGLAPQVDVQSWMGVPLVNQGHVVGLFILTQGVANAFDARQEQDVAFAFASQVAIALANADLFEQTFERTNELGTLLEASRQTSLARDLNDAFSTVAELMFTSLEMETCTIMDWDEMDMELEVQFSENRVGDEKLNMPVGTRYPVGNYPAREQALLNREVVVIIDTDNPDREPPYPLELEEMRANGQGARMMVPLVVRDESIGLIQLEQESNSEDSITQQKVRLARALGSQVAVAISNATLRAETTSRFEQLFTINQVSRSISSTLKLENMLPIVREQVLQVTNAEEIYLALYDDDTNMIRFPIAARSNGEEFVMEPRELGNDEVSYIIKRKHSLSLGADYFSIEELRRSMGIENGEGDITSYMGVPVKSGDDVLGVLAIRHYNKSRAFDINYDNILTTVAAQLGAAIQNARLFERVQQSAEELEKIVELRTEELEEERDRLDTLYQITAELARTLDMHQLLDRSLGMMSKAVNADDGVIMYIDAATDSLRARASLIPDHLIYLEDEDLETHPAQGLAMWLINNGDVTDNVVLVNDLVDQDYWDETGRATGMQSAIAIMLENNDDPIGVMVLLAKDKDSFNEGHLKLLVPAAAQVAASLNSADLYQLIRDQAERMGKLLRTEQEEAQKNNAILESVADGVMLADANGEIVLFNPAAERILELPREQALGQPVSRLTGLYGPAAVKWSQLVNDWSENPEALQLGGDSVTERFQLSDKIISVQLSPVYIGDLFLGTVSVFRDITSDVEADRAKAKFIENVSHEFRTPLTPIKGYTDMLLMTAADNLEPMQLDFVTRIKENADRLAILVNDVLNISKLDSGEDKMNMSQFNPNDLVSEVFNQLANEPYNTQKNIKTTLNLGDDVPKIRGDNEKLRQVFINLIDNAFNYTRPDGSITVTVKRLPDSPDVQIEIADTGVGIPDEFKEAAWRRFERYDQHAVELDVAGTGLGLSLARDLVRLHNGSIWFESELGVGTTFFIRLPIEQPNFRSSTMEMPKIDETIAGG